MNAGALYLYCLIPTGSDVDWGTGVAGERVEEIRAAEMTALVHRAMAGEPYRGPDDRVRAWVLEHNAVVERAWRARGSVLPASFDVLVRGEDGDPAEAKLRRWLLESTDALHSALARLRGLSEVKVDVAIDGDHEAIAGKPDPAIERARVELARSSPGVRVLLERKLEELERARVDRIADGLYPRVRSIIARAVSDVAEDRRARGRRVAALVFSGALLVNDEQIAALGYELARLKDSEEYLEIRFLGPWPPYSFTPSLGGAP